MEKASAKQASAKQASAKEASAKSAPARKVAPAGKARPAAKTRAPKRLLKADPLFAKRVAAAEAQLKVEQNQTTANKARFAEIQKAAAAEFARLQKLLG